MAIEHRNIPEDGLHEPKGASTAASDRVYVSDGNGSGSWDKVDADALQGTISNAAEANLRLITDGNGGFSAEPAAGRSRGMMTLTNNNVVKPMTAASDSTLATNTDYSIVELAFAFENMQGIGNGANYLEILQSGVYMVDFWANAKASNNNVSLALKFVVNDTNFIARRPKLRLPTAGEVSNFSANGFHEFQSGDQVKVAIASSVSTSITLEDLVFQMVLAEGL
jgi:hypothetical protein